MTFIKHLLSLLLLSLLITQCQQEETQPPYPTDRLIHDLNMELIKIISEDGFSPPVASRIYAYTNVAAYEATRLGSEKETFSGQLNGLTLTIKDDGIAGTKPSVLLTAFTETAKHFVYRDHLVDSLFFRLQDSIYLPEDLSIKATEIGNTIAEQIIAWADQDGYNQTRNLPKYEVKDGDEFWKPTQPVYGEALEPHWQTLRPFYLKTASQFRAEMPFTFSKDPNSEYYKAVMETYEQVNKTTSDDIDIAIYWDCNPGPTLINGHLMQVNKQNTPGGHWIGINKIACETRELSLLQSCQAYALLATAIADGFIAAWDTKYHYEFVRPETFINAYIDQDWKPKLESPPFPEFSSAHSLVSAVAAVILTELHGEDFPFFDDTNTYFNLPAKKFNNFWEAAEEAAFSRLLGGIHYKASCQAGLDQGRELGEYVLTKYNGGQ